MPTHWQIECLCARLRSQEAEITRVAEKDHPYPEPDIIYRALLEVLKERKRHLYEAIELWSTEEAVDLYTEEERSRILQVTFDTVVKDLQRIGEIFSLADRVDSPRIPFEILRSLSWVANTLLNEQCRTVVRLDTVYTYSIVSCRRKFEEFGWGDLWNKVIEKKQRKKKKKKKKDIDGGTSTVLVLGFPSPEAASILVHALAAHEFGHEIAHNLKKELRALGQQAVVEIKQKHNETLVAYVEDNVIMHEGVSRNDAYEKSRRLVEYRLLKLTENWLQELFSDLYAAKLVGPAFLSALDRILLRLDEPSLSHPSGNLRRQLVKKYLEDVLPDIVKDPVWIPLFGDTTGLKKNDRSSLEIPGDADVQVDPADDSSKIEGDEDSHNALLGPNSNPNDPLTPLYPIIEHLCELNLNKLSLLLTDITSPLVAVGDLKELVAKIETCIDHLAPPGVALEGDDSIPELSKFWLLMYAVWHYRLDEKRFNSFCTYHGHEGDTTKGENTLGNLVLHSLQSLELRVLWDLENRKSLAGGSGGS